jgi:acyl carrier protein
MSDVPDMVKAETERLIAVAWGEILELDSVDRNENFFDLGGDSLMLFALHVRLQNLLQRPVELLDLVRFPTVNSFAASILQPKPHTAMDEFQLRADKRRHELYVRAMRWRAS